MPVLNVLEEYQSVLAAFDPGDLGGQALLDQRAKLAGADWDEFFTTLTCAEYDVLRTMTESRFPLSRVRTIAKEHDRSPTRLFRGINAAGKSVLGVSVIDTASRQPRFESLVAEPISERLF